MSWSTLSVSFQNQSENQALFTIVNNSDEPGLCQLSGRWATIIQKCGCGNGDENMTETYETETDTEIYETKTETETDIFDICIRDSTSIQ